METAPIKNDSAIIPEKSIRVEDGENDLSWEEKI
jgi:hypothetical protein